MEEENKYCTLFDILQNEKLLLGQLMTQMCLSGAVMKKTVIIPPEKIIKEIDAMRSKEKKKNRLMDLILSRPEAFKGEDGSIVRSIRGSSYIISHKDDKLCLNDVEIDVGKSLRNQYLLYAKDELLAAEPEERVSGGKKHMRRYKKLIKGGCGEDLPKGGRTKKYKNLMSKKKSKKLKSFMKKISGGKKKSNVMHIIF